jgi:transcriptional regulator with XRE-family HTH domain
VNDQASEDIGAALRSARELSGLSLRNIADTTKLPIGALKALEENRIAQLPGGIYRRAIVRAYATEVGLDAQAVLGAFLARYPDDVPSKAFVAADETRSVPRLLQAALSLVGAIIPIVAGAVYFASTTVDSDSAAEASSLVATRTVDRRHPLVASASLSDTASLAMLISVSAHTRLAVIADGREVIARQLEPGEVIRLNASDDIVLMGDNAGAVHFSINGRPGRTLGDVGTPLSARIPRDDYLSWLIQQ